MDAIPHLPAVRQAFLPLFVLSIGHIARYAPSSHHETSLF